MIARQLPLLFYIGNVNSIFVDHTSKEIKTCSFFRPTILIDRLRELNKKLNGMRSEEIVETLEIGRASCRERVSAPV